MNRRACRELSRLLILLSVLWTGSDSHFLLAQPAAALPEVRPIPARGLPVTDEAQQSLSASLRTLQEKIVILQRRPDLGTAHFLPDVQIFAEAIRKAFEGDTFFGKQDPQHAEELLQEGHRRADLLLQGNHPWTTQRGLVVRGYRSRIDGSIQPYGLVIGAEVTPGEKPVRCDIWFRGRSEKSLELQFLYERMHNEGQYVLPQGIVLHPFGRYCNANRFAGEVDTFEALEHLQSNCPVDPDRISVRGFSMGGAACWGFTVHYPCKWFASNPGAGFSDTRQYLGMDKNPSLLPPEYQQRMWTLYDADVLADNLYNTHVVAYSGEIDAQKRAADIMVEAAAKRNITFPYIIGPQTAHRLHPESKKLIAAQMDEWSTAGRPQRRTSIHFSTFSLKYNHCSWLTLNGLDEHWQEAYVDADFLGEPAASRTLQFKTRNVNDFSIDCTPANSPFQENESIAITIDGNSLEAMKTTQKGALQLRFHRHGESWKSVSPALPRDSGLVKKHQLQGPVDDALMDSFLFVEPTGTFSHPAVENWVRSEMDRAAREWRRQMRGDVRFKKDTDVTPEDLKLHHVILWGCPRSNQLLGKIAGQLPVQWTADQLTAAGVTHDPRQNVPILIYPNPLNPERYVVLNSGMTFREADYLTNSRQTPKLPDWAIVDLSEKPSEYAPGKVIAADFFDEHWQFKPRKGE